MEIVNQFEVSLRSEGRSENTILAYSSAVNQFSLYHKGNVQSISQSEIDSFLSKFNSRTQTLNLKKNAIKKYLSFLKTRNFTKKEYIIKTKNVNRPEPEFFSYPEQKAFFSVLSNDRRFYRDFVLCSLMAYGGLRLGEVLALRISDVEGDSIIIRTSKTGSGKVLFKKKLKILVNEYLRVRKMLEPNSKEDFLFLSRRKTQIDSSTIQWAFKKYLQLAKIKKNISPHGLRHTFACRLRESGSDIEVIRRLLRHKHIQSSLIYSHIGQDILKQAIERI